MSNESVRIAVIGASGIGKNHAAWFQKHGADVVAFAGSSAESVTRTAEVLTEKLGKTPTGYDSVETLLKAEHLNAVCIASPPERHYEHVSQCLSHGLHVLCEKPLVYDPLLSTEILLAQGKELVRLAASHKLLLGTQMQYSLIATRLCELAKIHPDKVTTFTMEMETKNLKPGRSHETIWIEMAPHPLSVLQKIAGGGELDTETLECSVDDQETTAEFSLTRPNGHAIDARIVTRCNPQAASPLRRFTINDTVIDYAGRKNADGDFLTYLTRGGYELEMPDLVDILVGNFLDACRGKDKLEVTGADGARNVEWMLSILDRGVRV